MKLVQVSPTQGTTKTLSERRTGTKVITPNSVTVELISLGGILYQFTVSKLELEKLLQDVNSA